VVHAVVADRRPEQHAIRVVHEPCVLRRLRRRRIGRAVDGPERGDDVVAIKLHIPVHQHVSMGLAKIDGGFLGLELREANSVRVFPHRHLLRAKIGVFLGALERVGRVLRRPRQLVDKRECHAVTGFLGQVLLDLNHLGRARPHELLEEVLVQVLTKIPFVPLLNSEAGRNDGLCHLSYPLAEKFVQRRRPLELPPAVAGLL
jgi:hypothetical protein